jgi:hypothetical protein
MLGIHALCFDIQKFLIIVWESPFLSYKVSLPDCLYCKIGFCPRF